VAFLFKFLRLVPWIQLITGSNLKKWLQQDNLLRSQVAQATTQTQAQQNYMHVQLLGQKSQTAVEQRAKNMQRKEKSVKS